MSLSVLYYHDCQVVDPDLQIEGGHPGPEIIGGPGPSVSVSTIF